jgi:membrane protease YdiL (CAAX protease family)
VSPPAIAVTSRREWAWLLAGLVAIYAVLQLTAAGLGSERGEAGLIVGALVTIATLTVERVWTGRSIADAARALGLGAPRARGLAIAAAVCVLLVLVVPLFAWRAGAGARIVPGAALLVPGLFAQAGLAEELLFRGYLFGHLRRGRTFWRAAGLATVPFVAVHLLLFATMPWPIALAALLLAVIISFPLARLYELGGATIWPPALLHFVVQGTVKVVAFAGEPAASFPIVWMAASALVPWAVFAVRYQGPRGPYDRTTRGPRGLRPSQRRGRSAIHADTSAIASASGVTVPSGGICEDGRRERIRTNRALRSGAPGDSADVVPGVEWGRSHFVVRAASAATAASTCSGLA